jgi:hypothetical protein
VLWKLELWKRRDEPRKKKNLTPSAPPSYRSPSRRRHPWRPPRSPPPPGLSRSPSHLPSSSAGAVPPSYPSPPPSVRVHPSPLLPARLVSTSLFSGGVILTYHEPSTGHEDDKETAKGSGSEPRREPTSLAPYGISISPLSKVRTLRYATRRRLARRNHPALVQSDSTPA